MTSLFNRNKDMQRLADNDSVCVIGLGRFGRAVALELEASGIEVLGIDSDDRIVQEMSESLTYAVRADSTNEAALRQLAVHEFDRVVVAIGTGVEASLMTVSLIKRMGVKQTWAKALSEQHGFILEQLHVDHVVYPEREMGRRVAHLVKGRMLDFIEFEKDFAMVKTNPPAWLLGVPLAESGIRRKHGVTVVGVKQPGEAFTHATGETVLADGDMVIVSGLPVNVEKFSDLC